MVQDQEKRVDLFSEQGWITCEVSPFASQVVEPHFQYVPTLHSSKDVSNVQLQEI